MLANYYEYKNRYLMRQFNICRIMLQSRQFWAVVFIKFTLICNSRSNVPDNSVKYIFKSGVENTNNEYGPAMQISSGILQIEQEPPHYASKLHIDWKPQLEGLWYKNENHAVNSDFGEPNHVEIAELQHTTNNFGSLSDDTALDSKPQSVIYVDLTRKSAADNSDLNHHTIKSYGR